MTSPLTNATVASLPIDGPGYDRMQLTPGIVHIGVGNFHRAHQAVYLDRLMNQGQGLDFALIGAGVMPGDQRMADVLRAQDFLHTVVEQSAEEASARVIGPMIEMIGPGRPDELLAAMTDPRTRIVSLTITEGGYVTGSPVFTSIVDALKARKDAGVFSFTVMSCDNVTHNGTITRQTLVETARASDPELARWIDANVAFPNGMVDRITPATSDRERAAIRDQFGVEDAAPVFCEDWIQWVLEDNFPAGRPPLETVGVEFVDDVTPWELMKIRILNGGHATLAYPAGLLGITYVHEAMADERVTSFLDKVERTEIIGAVPPVPNTNTTAYFDKVVERCANPAMADTIARLCYDGASRQPKFIVPIIWDRLAAGQDVTGLALESALWCRYCAGTTDDGTPIEPNDPQWDRLTGLARFARTDPGQWLGMTDVYGEVGADERFARPFAEWLTKLWDDGVEATLAAYLA